MGAGTILDKGRELRLAVGSRIATWSHPAKRRSLRWFGNSIYRARRWCRSNAAKIEVVVWFLVATSVVFLLRHFQAWLLPHLDSNLMASLQTFAVTVGGAMIGATAIASSFVLFAMQVNVERLPYRLFYRFSSDLKLLSAFAASFVVAIGGTALSLISNHDQAALLIILELTAVLVVLRLLLLAYRRSFQLVNPVQQLEMIYRQTDRELRRFDKHIRWASDSSHEEENDGVDMSRRAILDANPGWDRLLRETIEHAVAFARRAGEQGDLEISATALNFVVALNARYVHVKGKTFFANNLLIDNPLVTDGTINITLEALRRLREAALTRRDEPQLEHIFSAYAMLTNIYLKIDYGPGQSKSHALLATGYLKRSIESVIPHSLVDAAMNGVRVLGSVAQRFFINGNSNEAVGCVSQISLFGILGATSGKYRPLTLAAMEELRDLSLLLFRVEERDIRFPAGQLRRSVNEVATAFLELPDTPLNSQHSSYLSPYFSSTSYTSFRSHLTNLINVLLNSDDAEAAERVADHITSWADGMYDEQKKLLLISIEKRSHFSFDIIHWITGITELLIAASRAPHTRSFARDKLEKHASWLFGTLTWIPTDKDTVSFVENLSFRSEVFETALRAQRDDWPDGFDAAWKLSMKWAVEAGTNQTGWGTLERWLAALCALALRGDINRSDQLKTELAVRIQGVNAPAQELRDRAARDLREMAEQIRERELELDLVKRILAANDRQLTQTLLREVADILSPGTANEPVQSPWL
jgi:hypothetical protein